MDIKKPLKTKMAACFTFFYELCDILRGAYQFEPSKGQDCCLIPNGTINELTYFSKPDLSFRISTHWNWYERFEKCRERSPDYSVPVSFPFYLQCENVDVPRQSVPDPDKPIPRKIAAQVAVMGGDGKYHVVFGEKYDRKTKTWSWINTDPADIAEMVTSQFRDYHDCY